MHLQTGVTAQTRISRYECRWCPEVVVKGNHGKLASSPGLAPGSPHKNEQLTLSMEDQARPSFPSSFPTWHISTGPGPQRDSQGLPDGMDGAQRQLP